MDLFDQLEDCLVRMGWVGDMNVGCFCIKVRKLSQSSHSGDALNPNASVPGFWRLEALSLSAKPFRAVSWTPLDSDEKLRDSVDVETPKISS